MANADAVFNCPVKTAPFLSQLLVDFKGLVDPWVFQRSAVMQRNAGFGEPPLMYSFYLSKKIAW